MGVPEGLSSLTTRRVDVNCKWDFFWARDSEHRYLLALRFCTQSMIDRNRPRLRGLDVLFTSEDDCGYRMLVFRLLDSMQKDIFQRFCSDVIVATKSAKSERDALYLALMRTWRWHYLLRTGRRGHLSSEQQKGLIGELLVLEERLFPIFSVLDAVKAWQGPLDATKDFEIGRCCIEAKTRRGTATPHIVVNSEHQLDSAGLDRLFLYVVELDSIAPGSAESFTLTDVVSRVSARVMEEDNAAVEAFEIRLAAAGYCQEDDYSNFHWVQGKSLLYKVTDDFPRIVSWGLNTGITKVRYSLSLAECEDFLCADHELEQALSERKDE